MDKQVKYQKIACVADNSEIAKEAHNKLKTKYDLIRDPKKADVIIALGGDGFMLHTLHNYLELNIPVYGMNCGTVGFLMNEFSDSDLVNKINEAKEEVVHPLKMIVKTVSGKKHEAIAINEVSLLRETRQAAHIRISIDSKVRMDELVCDGILVATPAGSSAYNLSVHGPVIPLGTNILALTPISPFRPRRWRGALLPYKAKIKFEIMQNKKRPVSAVADFTEVRDVKTVEVRQSRSKKIKLLFNPGHSLEERIIGEQFQP